MHIPNQLFFFLERFAFLCLNLISLLNSAHILLSNHCQSGFPQSLQGSVLSGFRAIGSVGDVQVEAFLVIIIHSHWHQWQFLILPLAPGEQSGEIMFVIFPFQI